MPMVEATSSARKQKIQNAMAKLRAKEAERKQNAANQTTSKACKAEFVPVRPASKFVLPPTHPKPGSTSTAVKSAPPPKKASPKGGGKIVH